MLQNKASISHHKLQTLFLSVPSTWKIIWRGRNSLRASHLLPLLQVPGTVRDLKRFDMNAVDFLYHEYLGFGSVRRWIDKHLAEHLYSSDPCFHPPCSLPVSRRAVRLQRPISHLSGTCKTRALELCVCPWLSPRSSVYTWMSPQVLQHSTPHLAELISSLSRTSPT